MNLPISIRGARQHNLRNLDLDLPSNKLIAFCGPSGSGKSSLAFDTLFSESRRRFLDCLSARSRQGMDQPEKPEVDSITGLPPALCLEQSARQQSSRTLLGSITEILDYLRILYAAAGTPHDPETGKKLERKSPDRITEELVSLPEHTRLVLAAPAENLLSQDPAATLGDFQRQGFLRVYWNGEMRDIEEISSPAPPPPDAALVIDRLIVRGENTASRIADSLQTALRINPDEVRAIITIPGEEVSTRAFHTRYRNPETGFLLPQLTPRHFSFNSPLGACPSCRGTGLNEQENGPCRACGGKRLSPLALAVTMSAPDRAYNLAELTALPLEDMAGEQERLKTPPSLAAALNPLMEEINKRVRFLNELGLSYLSLDRQANTLSGGELQRARLASQLGGGLSGVLYILDEPSIGLHSRDTDKLIHVLRQLQQLGNTVVVVEHDEEIIRAADYIIDIGPKAGRLGGEVVYCGDMKDLQKDNNSYTVRYLLGEETIPVPESRRPWNQYIEITGARENNLKGVDVRFPLNVMTVVTGVSGSGKSTLVRDIFFRALKRELDECSDRPGEFASIGGDLKELRNVEFVDQNPIGKSSRSNPVTYIKAYDEIRKLWAEQPLAKQMGYTAGHFSFNSEGGRCEECKGEGTITVEMQFMADLVLECESCHGKRFKSDTLEVKFHDVNIYDVLEMTVNQAIEFFTGHGQKKIVKRLQPLQDVGLGYIKLGQSSSTLSGGENQRVKLAYYLSMEKADPTLFIFDEPTTGLHFHDIRKLLEAFDALIRRGHSIVIIEHNMDVVKCADHVIDLGPEGGDKGGYIVATGTPEEVAACAASYTGQFLKEKLQ